MSTEIFPIDLIDHTLSFLRSDIDTLKTCAKSHPILSDLSERYIYADVVLRDDIYDISTPKHLRTSEFNQLLANKPTIANHVRTLEVVCVSADRGPEQPKATSSHLNGVASLLPMLTGVTRFTIRGSLDDNECFRWHAMPETFCQAFKHHLHPRDIIIRYISFFPMSFLNDCKNVRLYLEHCDEMQYDGQSCNGLQSYPLEHLSVSYCSTIGMQNVAAWVKLYAVRSLKYEAFWFSSSLQEIFVACSYSLTSLHLDTSQSYNTETPYQITNDSAIPIENVVHFPFTLASLYHITHLLFTLGSSSYVEGYWNVESPLPAVLELLSTAPPTLKQVSIELRFVFAGPDFDPEHLPDLDPIWTPFIPLAARCASASISLHISPSFRIHKEISPDFSPFTDYKGLTPYVQSGVVVIREDDF